MFTRRGIFGLLAGAIAGAALPALPKQTEYEPLPTPPPAPPVGYNFKFEICGAYNPKHDCECYRHPGHTGTHGCYVAEKQPDKIDWSHTGSLHDTPIGPTITYIEWPRGLYPQGIDGVFAC